MKMKTLFASMLAIMLFALTACKTSPKDALARKWKATDASGPMITPEIKKQILGESSTIEFNKDGSFTAWTNGKEQDKGTYTLSEDAKTLTTKSATTGREEPITVKELTKDKMVGEMQNIVITFEPAK